MNRQGFTLTELLVAGTIFVLSCLIFTGLLQSCKRLAQRTKLSSQNLCQLGQQAEKLQAVAFNDLRPLNGQTFAGQSGTIVVQQLADDLVRVDLTLNKKSLCLLRSKY